MREFLVMWCFIGFLIYLIIRFSVPEVIWKILIRNLEGVDSGKREFFFEIIHMILVVILWPYFFSEFIRRK